MIRNQDIEDDIEGRFKNLYDNKVIINWEEMLVMDDSLIISIEVDMDNKEVILSSTLKDLLYKSFTKFGGNYSIKLLTFSIFMGKSMIINYQITEEK